MTSSSSDDDKNTKIKKVIKILNFILTLDDEEVIKSSIESVVEMLEEEVE